MSLQYGEDEAGSPLETTWLFKKKKEKDLHRWRARIIVASVSEWHLWIRWGSLESESDVALLLFPTLWSKHWNTGRSSLSSFRLLFSCIWTLESSDEGSLLLNGGPPTYRTWKSDQITTIITQDTPGSNHQKKPRGCHFTQVPSPFLYYYYPPLYFFPFSTWRGFVFF